MNEGDGSSPAGAPAIRVKRVYDPVEAGDGTRVLVDGLWPRGLSREAARLDRWLRAVAPSKALRQWFRHDPARWDAFCRAYRQELAEKPDALAELADLAAAGTLTLLVAARDWQHNHAVVLARVLAERTAAGG